MKKQTKVVVLLGLFIAFALFASLVSSLPSGANGATVRGNSTLGAQPGYQINVSGGYIAYINISATVQNLRWKAFVGNVTGKFTLSDSSGNTIYDWTLASVTGRVFTTRNSSSVAWVNISCANLSSLERENILMNHSSPYDNITRTFNNSIHDSFYVGSLNIPANNCSSLATYRNSASQTANFQEVALTDSNTTNTGKIVYSTKMESQLSGYDNSLYDFQMIVPENGLVGNTGITPYYLYVELT